MTTPTVSQQSIGAATRVVACRACDQSAELHYTPTEGVTASAVWTCPYASTCGKTNYIALPGILTGVTRATK